MASSTLPAVVADGGDERPRFPWPLCCSLHERRRLEDPQTDEQADADEHDAEQERHAPAPREELLFGQAGADHAEDDRRQEQPGGHAHLRPAAREAAPAGRRMLDGHQHRAAPLAAHADALHAPQQHQQHRRPDADRLVGGQQADEERRHAHDHQRVDQHRLAPDAIAEVAEDDAAERAGDEADGEGAERRQRADERIDVREEEAVEDERRGRAVEEEVVPLDGGADEARHASRRGRRPPVWQGRPSVLRADSRWCTVLDVLSR